MATLQTPERLSTTSKYERGSTYGIYGKKDSAQLNLQLDAKCPQHQDEICIELIYNCSLYLQFKIYKELS